MQGLRALAVLVVVAFHAGLPIRGGFIGVDIFFVISGFVITAMLTREWESTGRIQFRRFYLRRFRRLTPALALMVSVTMLASAVVLSPVGPQQVASQTALGAMLLIANVVIAATTGDYFDESATLNPLLHTWSLSVEEQFYLLFPLILAAGWTAARRHHRLGVVPVVLVTAIWLLSFALAVGRSAGYQPSGQLGFAFGFYSPLTRAWEFAAGAGLALLAAKFPRQSTTTSTIAGGIGALCVAASLWLVTETTPFPGVATLLPVLGTVLVIYAGGGPGNPVSRLLATGPMVRMGDRSYSIYLWHWPFITMAGMLWPGRPLALPLAAAAAVAPALASYRWVEQPGRTRPLLACRPRLRAAVVAVVAGPLVLALSVGYAADKAYWDQGVRAFRTSRESFDVLKTCPAPDLGSCRWNTRAPGLPVYLVGDSHAGQFADAVRSAAAAEQRPLAISMRYNCPFAAQLVVALAEQPSDCSSHNDEVLDTLAESTPGVVVIAGADHYLTNDEWAVGPRGAVPSTEAGPKARVWEEALTRTVERLRRSGHSVVLVQTVPLHDAFHPERCSTIAMGQGQCSDDLPRGDALRQQGLAREVVTRVAGRTGSTTLDLWDFFCRGETCQTQREGLILYRNWNHVSVAASHALTGRFREALVRTRPSDATTISLG